MSDNETYSGDVEEKKTPSEPQFTNGTHIAGPALVVDEHGRAWWVNPHTQILRRASAS